MKKIVKALTATILVMLCLAFGVSASEQGYLVKFKEGFCPDTIEYGLKEVNSERGIYSVESMELLDAFLEYVEYSEPNDEVSLIDGQEEMMPVSLFSEQEQMPWHLTMINADNSKYEAYGNEIRVAVIDSGCYPHDDLKNNLLEGKNYFTGTNDVTDYHGHGTHVSGIIAAKMSAGGVCGVAPKAKIVPMKCFDDGEETYIKDILDAIYDAVDIYECKVINMSWGVPGGNDFLKEAIDYAYAKGAILIAAVGNYSSSDLYYPAAYDNVIGVSSVNEEMVHSHFAQYNKSVLVSAPGDIIRSTYKNGGYAGMRGTSQAAPVVSGIAAVALSIDPTLTNEEFKQLLIETSYDLGDEGYDVYYGHGLVNESALIDRVFENVEKYISPVKIKGTEASVLVKNNSESTINATSIFCEYDGKRFVGFKQVPVVLEPGQETVLNCKVSNDNVSHFLWDSFESLKPVVVKRTNW